jgi:hypothetical protein
MKRILLPLLLATVAAPALALDLTEWGKEGDWVILIDPNHDNNCLAQVSYSDGSLLRVGFREKGKEGILATVNPAWDFKKDDKYLLNYSVDGGAGIDAESKGVAVGEMKGVEVPFKDPAVLYALVKGNSLTLTYEGNKLADLSLAGSAAALEKAAVCELEQHPG